MWMYFLCICGEEGDLHVLLFLHLEGLPHCIVPDTDLYSETPSITIHSGYRAPLDQLNFLSLSITPSFLKNIWFIIYICMYLIHK